MLTTASDEQLELTQRPEHGWAPGRGTKPEQYRARDVFAEADAVLAKYHNAQSWWGDQQQTSECTIYAWLHCIHDGPITHPTKAKPVEHPTRLYRIGQSIDGTPHTHVHSGLTSNASAQVFLRAGYIGEYRWVEDFDEFLNVLAVQPVTCGAWWPGSFDAPDEDGFVEWSDSMVGGHQWKIDGFNKRRRIVRHKNSWGRGWGKNGFFYTTFDTMAKVFERGGAEIATYRELR